MFETEAGFAETKMLINCNGDYSKKQDYKKGWQDGAEFGYNKANEWHYVKNGDLPKEGEDVLLYFTLPDKSRNDIVIGNLKNGDFWNVDLEDVIAWKEIELPKEIKENERRRT